MSIHKWEGALTLRFSSPAIDYEMVVWDTNINLKILKGTRPGKHDFGSYARNLQVILSVARWSPPQTLPGRATTAGRNFGHRTGDLRGQEEQDW